VLKGLNHITIAVNNLDESFDFYVNLLGMTAHAKWIDGAYLTLNDLWFCLSCDTVVTSSDYSHLAFDVSATNFETLKSHLINKKIKQWQVNKSEGRSFYFLDPNGHKLELHVGSLSSRLASLKLTPYGGLEFY